jgi:hypothetical protein
MRIHTILASALVLLHFSAVAQNLQKIATTETLDFYLRPYSLATRVGSAVMVKIYAVNRNNKYAYSHRVLLSCENKWISTTFFDNVFFENLSGPQDFADRLDRKEPEYDRIAIEQTTIGASELKYVGALSKRTAAICKSANREPRNTLIPISSSIQEGDIGRTQELVTGTRSRVGKEIDVWLRTTEYKRSEIKNTDGSTFLIDGQIQYSYERTKSYSMRRSAFDCEKRKLTTYEVSTYTADSATPNTEAFDRDKVKLTSAVPGSIGESQLDWVCSLYFNGSQ